MIPGLHGGADPFVVALAALAGDLALAGLPGLRRLSDPPAALAGAAAARLEARLNRPQRSGRNRAVRGLLTLGVFVLAGTGVGFALLALVRAAPQGWAPEAALVAVFLVQRREIDRARAIGAAVKENRPDDARALLRKAGGQDASGLDDHAVLRAAAQSCARRACDGIASPVFWYLLLGLPALCAFRAVNALAHVVGRPGREPAAFGRAAARADWALNLVPDAVAGLLVAAAAVFVPGASARRALGAIGGDTGTLFLPAGRTQHAAAAALDLAFGGPVLRDGTTVARPWIGDGRARALPPDLARAVYLVAVTGLLALALVALVRIALGYSPT